MERLPCGGGLIANWLCCERIGTCRIARAGGASSVQQMS